MAYPTAAQPRPSSFEMQRHISENRIAFMLFGLLLIGLGILAIAHPFLTTLAAKIVLGWTLLIVGVAQVIQSLSAKAWSEFFLNLLMGLIYAAVGAWLVFFPLTGMLTLTIVLAATFIVQGFIELAMGLRMRPSGGWFALLLAGAVAIVVGVMIMYGLPSTATWAIGLMVGVNLIVSGVTYIVIALTARLATW